MTLEQRVAVLEEIFAKLQDYYTSAYSGEEIDARLASAGVPVGITKEYKSVTEMNQDFTGTDVQRGQFVLILPDSTASADYGKVYLKGTANWVYAFTLTTLTSIKGPIGPPGKKGDQGDPGEAGSSFAILGYFDTLDALKAAVPNPKAGDVYGVGTAPPYNIYIWDSVHGKWVGNGNLQGPPGEQGIQGPEGKQGSEGKQGPEGPVGGSSNFVRYDAAQTLTDEQKTQARTNINAAPGGYGYGDTLASIDINNDEAAFNSALDALLSGLENYVTKQIRFANYPVGGQKGGTFVGTLYKHDATYAVLYGSSYDGGTIQKRKLAGAWQPWEWVNPPMELGVEYRTTERYLGKPVYTKLLDCGQIADNKQVEHGIVNMRDCIFAQGLRAGMPMPYIYNHNLSDPWSFYIAAVNDTKITFACGTSAAGGNCHVILKYTKVTD